MDGGKEGMVDMFNKFYEFFGVRNIVTNNMSVDGYGYLKRVSGFIELLRVSGGKSFGNGLYRLHLIENIVLWNREICTAYPEFSGRIDCFGYDWLGRHFCVDYGRLVNDEPQILMFEPGTGEVLEIPCSFIDFHESEIPNYHNECLASDFYHTWLSKERIDLDLAECVGYKVPLFLGGRDTIDNLEKINMDVYWTISAQLIRKTKGIPQVTR